MDFTKSDMCIDIISSPGLCPWKAYAVTQLLASASVSASTSAFALAQCFKFSKVCIVV